MNDTGDAGQTAYNVIVRNNVPSGLNVSSCQATGGATCTPSGNQVVVNYPALGPGQTETVTLVAQVDPSFTGAVLETPVSASSDQVNLDLLASTSSSSFLVNGVPVGNPPASVVASGGTAQSVVVGSAFPNALQVIVTDSGGNSRSGVVVSFTAPSSGASAALSSGTAVTNGGGVASVTATANNTAGSYTVTAAVGGLAASFSLTNLPGGGGNSNLARGKVATQSSTLPGYPGAGASAAVDGSSDGNFNDGSVTATNLDANAWWQVDLGASTAIGSIAIWNRTDCCGSRLSDYWVFVSDTPFGAADTPATLAVRAGTWSSHQTAAPNPSTTITAGTQGRYLRVQLSGTNYLSLAEVQVFGLLPLTVSHTGNFTQGQPVALYTILVQNPGSAASAGNVTVADTLPAGLTATSIGGPGWACTLGTVTCSRSDSLTAAGSYPPITVTVNVDPNAASAVTNQAVLSGALGTASASDATTIKLPFVDVSSTDSFLPAIDLLWESAITSGCQASPPGYCPNDNITLGQMAVFVVRSVMGNDNFTYTTTPYFTDVPASYVFFKWVQKMQDLGIAVPCGANLYCPDTPVTRGVMAVLIIRGRYGISTPSSYPVAPYFTDVTAIHPYFAWIQKMKQVGITSGCSPTTYCPSDSVTRGQMAVFIMRGEFNQLLPASTPLVSWISQGSASPGKSVTVTITGQNTNFSSGVTQVSVGGGITASNISVINGTTLTAQLTVDGSSVLGPRSITVTTGNEEAALPNGFWVQ